MQICTASVLHAEALSQLGFHVLSVSPEYNGDHHFTPSVELIHLLNGGRISVPHFVDRYFEEMRVSYDADPSYWVTLLRSHPQLAIIGRPPFVEQCWRKSLSEIFLKIARHHFIDCDLLGEFDGHLFELGF